jgi:hypothetical protein
MLSREANMLATTHRRSRNVARAVCLLIVGMVLGGCGINTIPTLQERAKASWSEVLNQYQRRADLIPNLVETVKGYAAQESKVLTDVVEARAKATQVRIDVSQLSDPEKLKRKKKELDPARGVRMPNRAPWLPRKSLYRAHHLQVRILVNRFPGRLIPPRTVNSQERLRPWFVRG